MTPASLRALLAGAVDYAGLFPPARLDMLSALATWREWSGHWMMGRFVAPVARFDELERAGFALFSSSRTAPPCRVAALLGETVGADLARIADFNERAGTTRSPLGSARVDVVELKATGDVEAALAACPHGLTRYVEVPVERDPAALLAVIARCGARAKIRTGGVTPDAMPRAADVMRFVAACAHSGVAFKATAGLHHAVSGEYALTGEPGAPRAAMYGYLNVLIASCLVWLGRAAEAERILVERDATDLVADATGVRWRDTTLRTGDIARARRTFVISFGSCSIDEPVGELRTVEGGRS